MVSHPAGNSGALRANRVLAANQALIIRARVRGQAGWGGSVRWAKTIREVMPEPGDHLMP